MWRVGLYAVLAVGAALTLGPAPAALAASAAQVLGPALSPSPSLAGLRLAAPW